MTQVDFYDKEQIDAMNVGKETDTASASGSLWARLKDALNKITGKANDDEVVKLTGDQTVAGTKTFSSSPIVPDTPATEHAAVAQTWVENVAYVDDTVNNVVHKEGNETINGVKTHTGGIVINRAYPYITLGNSNLGQYMNIIIVSKDPTDADTTQRLMRCQIRHLETSTSCNIAALSPTTHESNDFYIISKDNGEKYIGVDNVRVTSLAQVTGNTTYNNDIVTVGMLKALGLIS